MKIMVLLVILRTHSLIKQPFNNLSFIREVSSVLRQMMYAIATATYWGRDLRADF